MTIPTESEELRLLLGEIEVGHWRQTSEGDVAAFPGYQLHIANERYGGRTHQQVWLNTDQSLFDGLRIGESVEDAIATLEIALVRLRLWKVQGGHV